MTISRKFSSRNSKNSPEATKPLLERYIPAIPSKASQDKYRHRLSVEYPAS